jgi:hypothetical protein
MSPIAAALAAPLITTLLAAFGVWWKGRIDRRDRAKERQRILAEIREEVNVIKTWVEAYNLIAPAGTRP